MGGRRVRGLKPRVGGSAALVEEARWTRLNIGGIQAGRVQGERHCVGRCGTYRKSKKAAGVGQHQERELSKV